PLPSVATAAYSKTCLPCHADGRVDLSTAAQNHVWFPLAGADTHALGKSFILAGSTGPVVLQCATCHQDTANRQDVTCTTCHVSQVTDTGFKDPHIGFAERSCDSCHGEAKDRVVTNHAGIGILIQDPSGPNNAGPCLQCHPNGGSAPVGVPFSHPFFPVDSAAKHPMGATVVRAGGESVTFACSSCHVVPTDTAQVDCTTCHSQASMTSGARSAHQSVPDVPAPFTPGTATSVGMCLQCHADGKVPVSLTYSTAKVGTHDALYGFQVSAGSHHATTNTNPSEKCSTCHSVTKPIAGV